MILFVLLFGKEFAESWMVGRKVWDGRFGWKVSLEGSARSFAAEKFGSEGLVRRFDWKVSCWKFSRSSAKSSLKVRGESESSSEMQRNTFGIQMQFLETRGHFQKLPGEPSDLFRRSPSTPFQLLSHWLSHRTMSILFTVEFRGEISVWHTHTQEEREADDTCNFRTEEVWRDLNISRNAIGTCFKRLFSSFFAIL